MWDVPEHIPPCASMWCENGRRGHKKLPIMCLNFATALSMRADTAARCNMISVMPSKLYYVAANKRNLTLDMLHDEIARQCERMFQQGYCVQKVRVFLP